MNRNHSLLIVEDDRDFAESLRLVFSIREIATQVVHSGEEALLVFDPAEHAGILMDIRLPGINGVETLRQLKGRHPAIPILLMTGCDRNSMEVTQARDSGATELLFKPFKITMLLDQIESILQKKDTED